MSNASYIDNAISGDVERIDLHPDSNQCPECKNWVLKTAPKCTSCANEKLQCNNAECDWSGFESETEKDWYWCEKVGDEIELILCPKCGYNIDEMAFDCEED